MAAFSDKLRFSCAQYWPIDAMFGVTEHGEPCQQERGANSGRARLRQ